MIDILYFIIIAFIAYGTGKALLRLFIREDRPLSEDLVFSTGLGLAVLGYLVFSFGSFGFLYLRYILLMLLICALIAIRPVYRLIRSLSWRGLPQGMTGLGGFEKFLLLLLILLPLISLLGAVAPPIGNDGLAYHLYHPKVFIQNHSIGQVPYTRESLWPYLTEMLFTLGLLLKSPACAKLFHLFFGLLSACAVFSFTKTFFSRKEALFAGALFYSAPGIFMVSTGAHVDLSLCFYSFVGFYALMLWHRENKLRFLILSGIFTGLALSVKLIAGITLMALCANMLYIHFVKRSNPRFIIKTFFVFMASASLVCCVWYIRSYLILGNPVFPFLHNIFGKGYPMLIGADLGTSRDIIGFLRLPWDLVMHIKRFGGEQIGVISLAFLPCVFFLPLKKDVVRGLLIFLFIYSAIWLGVNPNVRFGFVIFAVAYILIGAGVYRFLSKYDLPVLKILLSTCLIFNLFLCLYYNRDAIRLSLAMISEEEYLLANERSYPVAKYINKNLPLNSVLIMAGEPRFYYFDRRIVDSWVYERVSKDGLLFYVNSLKDEGVAVYLLHKSDVEYPNTSGKFYKLIEQKKPIYSFTRKIKGDKPDTYQYRLYEM